MFEEGVLRRATMPESFSAGERRPPVVGDGLLPLSGQATADSDISANTVNRETMVSNTTGRCLQYATSKYWAKAKAEASTLSTGIDHGHRWFQLTMSNKSVDPRARRRLMGLGTGLVLGALMVGGLVWFQDRSDDSTERLGPRCHQAQLSARRAVGQQVWQTHGQQYLADLQREEEAALDDALTQVNRYFARAGESTDQFTKAVLSPEGQWALVLAKTATLLEGLDRLPTWLKWRWLNRKARILAAVLDRDAFRKFVWGRLEHHVMSKEGIEGVVYQAVQRYQLRLEANDRALRGAFGGSQPTDKTNAKPTPPPTPTLTSTPGPRHLATLYQATALDARHRSSSGAHAELLRTLIARVGSKVLVSLAAYALKEGAVELGLLSAATASALWSFGVGLAVAALANIALRFVSDRIGKSPHKAIAQRLASDVASMRRCVVEGCKRTVGTDSVTIPGLRTWLHRYRTARHQRRTRALRQTLGLAAS